jgi:hypothetical protein
MSGGAAGPWGAGTKIGGGLWAGHKGSLALWCGDRRAPQVWECDPSERGGGGRTFPPHPFTAHSPRPQDADTTTTTLSAIETTTDQSWDRRPALTLLGVIVAWYAGTIGVVLSQTL